MLLSPQQWLYSEGTTYLVTRDAAVTKAVAVFRGHYLPCEEECCCHHRGCIHEAGNQNVYVDVADEIGGNL
jgi:hypothetical protein